MKALLVLAISLLGLMDVAAATTGLTIGGSWMCKQRGIDDDLAMILTPKTSDPVVEGKEFPFHLLINNRKVSGPLLVSEDVMVSTEDVMFGFTNADKSIVGMIYLDELEESYVTVNGKTIYFDCNP